MKHDGSATAVGIRMFQCDDGLAVKYLFRPKMMAESGDMQDGNLWI